MFIIKRDISPFTLPLFKEKLLKVDWGLLYTIKDLNKPCKTFLNVFSNLYKIVFPQIKIKLILKPDLEHFLHDDYPSLEENQMTS